MENLAFAIELEARYGLYGGREKMSRGMFLMAYFVAWARWAIEDLRRVH